MKTVKKPSVIPIYAIGAAWVLFTVFRGIRSISDLLAIILISVLCYVIGSMIFPAKVVQVEDKKAAAPKAEPKPAEPAEDPEITALKQERDRAISEMRRLNDNIPDPQISLQIDHLESTTDKIFAAVLEKPERKGQISKFLNYFLPTTIKLLNAYDRADSAGIDGENVNNTKQRVAQMLTEIESAFDRQLDALYGAENLDVATDIKVMETMLAQEGLLGSDFGEVLGGH